MLQIITLGLFIFALQLPFNVTAATQDNSWGNVYKFQTKMAERGSVSAQYILGEMYEEGRGVERSETKAIQWYEKARRNGHQDAAIRINQIKNKMAKEALEKKIKKQKIKAKKQASIKSKYEKKIVPVKKVSPSVAKAVKVSPPESKPIIVKPIAKPITQKVVQSQKKINKSTPAPIKTRPKRTLSSSSYQDRIKGTHFDVDESESPFE